jgi:hypothetical protein
LSLSVSVATQAPLQAIWPLEQQLGAVPLHDPLDWQVRVVSPNSARSAEQE